MKLTELSAAKVAVWGFGVEARATLEYLQHQLPELKVTVLCPANEAQGVHHFDHDEVNAKKLSMFDVVIKSPGISPYQQAVNDAECQIISPTALWFANEAQHIDAQVIAVTGTKGKSTTSSMIAHVLTILGFEVALAGNIGVPLISITQCCDYIVLETSSYQAHDGAIVADLAVMLNLYEEHLDWHGQIETYHYDKWRLLQFAKKVIVNHADVNTSKLLQKQPLSGSVSYFGDVQGFYALDNTLMYQDKTLLSKNEWNLKGRHNLLNAAAVFTVISELNLSIQMSADALKSFRPLPHRLQLIGEFNGIQAINDSISSTPQSTLAALETVEVERTIVLLGGYERDLDWQDLAQWLVHHVPKMIVCNGANGRRIKQSLAIQGVQSLYYDDLEQAVKMACQHAVFGDVILLSPGAPSFDQFANYQRRGVQFEAWINTYLG